MKDDGAITKWVYTFGGGSAEGTATMKNLLGGKGANLAEMAGLGLPVPPGFTVTTDVCTYYYANDRTYPGALKSQVDAALSGLEKIMGMQFGDADNPLLVSVRSGARASMPGMMDTILNLGLNDTTVRGLATRSNDERFAWDSYRRFIQMYSNVVLDVSHHHFESILQHLKDEKGYKLDTDLTAGDWQVIVERYKIRAQEELSKPFPQDVWEQLWGAIGAVFGSWMNQRAITYRRLNEIPASWGTAVNVQCMVFGNMGEESATGVCFSRDPATGENTFYGEYLVNAQGEDVVAGIRTPQQITALGRQKQNSELLSMEEVMPALYRQLYDVRGGLEAHYRDMQDMEFTIQQGRLWMLQTRVGKRTAKAALKIAVDMAKEELITRREAVQRVDPTALDQLLHPTIDPQAHKTVIAHGLPASPGAASGQVVFSADDSEGWVKTGKKVILVRVETSPEDIGGMHVSEGILTTRGGMTSHAAVVARGMGTPCVAGAGTIAVNYAARTFTVKDHTVKEGDVVTIDGSTGDVMLGAVAMIQPELTGDFGTLMEWADVIRTMRVRTNAETPNDAATARKFGAEGIGLCRTEHMFFDPKRIIAVREMILAKDEGGRRAALLKLLPFQRQDFVDLFTIMQGLPVTIRLLDPPLHEFLPHTEAEIAEVAIAAGLDPSAVRERNTQLREANPMLGHRGCRLGITYPEIYEIQAQAIFEGAVDVTQKGGTPVVPEIMIPLVGTRKELDMIKYSIVKIADSVFTAKNITLQYQVGTMIELPRAALRADEIADCAEFFSFGTNDLTQTTLGMSRDDSAPFLEVYKAKNIYEKDPFATLDTEGVGELVKIAAERGRRTRADLKLGICGEHGGDPASIMFCQTAGLDYVSCSPFRVPIARLAAAQAAIGTKDESQK
ncbi:Pyruvate,phosphate dikinase [invertebrate metagenome]|uniref:pyruvate, phosphate dikinase n=1 Tax=invertebrate metagenome TaxID=1711999 RepID=A0A484H647_9ZZZZ